MPHARHGEVELYYTTLGRRGDPVILLISGAGRQSIDFGETFCSPLVKAGYRLIRFDSRDTGRSTGFAGPSHLTAVYDAVTAGQAPPLVYGLQDMAADALAVLRAEGVDQFHIIGRSLGSSVAQALALSEGARVLSLSLIMAFSRSIASAVTRERMQALEGEVIADESAYVARQVRAATLTGSPAYLDTQRVAQEATEAFLRGLHLGGVARHYAVGLALPDLRPALGDCSAPTLVIHGALDQVIPRTFAEETAGAIPGARLVILEDMAHDGPPELERQWTRLILDHLGHRDA